MEGFHKRYMASNKALKLWIAKVREFDIEMIAPQHGVIFRREESELFLKWLETLKCGMDIGEDIYNGRLH